MRFIKVSVSAELGDFDHPQILIVDTEPEGGGNPPAIARMPAFGSYPQMVVDALNASVE